MIKRIMVLFIIHILLIYSINLQADPPIPTGRRLKEIVEDEYADSVLIGGTTEEEYLWSNTGIILRREFNYVTPENDFKQWYIHPNNSTYYNWVNPDRWVVWINYYNIETLRMHCPIGPQCSDWAKDDNRTPEELDTNMCDFLQVVCQRYNDSTRFKYMDVVNETVINGNWHTNKPGTDWECPWYIIGQDTDPNQTPLYIRKAFEIADSFAPDIKLIYNHHEHPANTASWNLIKETVIYLKGLGLRVDGIGWQAHVDKGWESESRLNALRALIDWAHSNSLEFHVTEASVWVKDGPSQEHFEEQAVTYRAIVDVLLEKRFTGKVGWNTWHIDDGHGWHTEWYPSLFDDTYEAKPAYYAIQAALEEGAGVVDREEDIPVAFKLYNNPNPFSSMTSICFEIPRRSNVSLKLYDTSGREISTLFSGYREAGRYIIEWNAKGYPSGIYFCYLTAENFVGIKKMIYVE